MDGEIRFPAVDLRSAHLSDVIANREETMSDFEQAVRARAYELWDTAGRPDNRSDEFWLAAESEIRCEQDAAEVAPASDSANVIQMGEPNPSVAAAA